MRSAFLAVLLVLAVPGLALTQTTEATGDAAVVKAAHLGSTGPALVEFFKQRTQRTATPEKLHELIEQLSDKQADVRDKASAGLVSAGMVAVPLLRQAANNIDDNEAATRARDILKYIEGEEAATLTCAAARLLAEVNPDGAVDALLGFLPFAESDKAAQQVEESLVAVAAVRGKLHPALLRAVKDQVPLRRAVAADVICQVGDADQRQTVKALLKDDRVSVRYRVALGLARRSEAEAIPALIDLLADLAPGQRARCEEFLTELAGDWTVQVPAGNGEFERKLRREVWRAWWKASEGSTLLDEFRKRTPTSAERTRTLELIKDLTKESARERDRAAAGLVEMGVKALSLLRKFHAEGAPQAAEATLRCIEAIEKAGASKLPSTAARLLALRKPKGAGEALLAYVPYADDEMSDALQEVLPELALDNGKPDPAFVTALTDALPSRRIAAVEALAAHSTAQEKVRKLLEDKDFEVRLKAALALAGNGDKEGVPTLIALLADGPADAAWQAEDYLARLAGDKRPEVSLGDETSRTKAREAWARWWKEKGDKVVLARREPLKRLLGYTLIVEQNNNFTGMGRVVELGPDNKVRWEVGQLQWPMAAQVIGPDRVLIAEQNISRVSERDFKGNVKWQKQVNQPFACERLKNGNTFIACRNPNQLIEVDREGKEVVSIQRNADYFQTAAPSGTAPTPSSTAIISTSASIAPARS
jgi:HEAT repeat protein